MNILDDIWSTPEHRIRRHAIERLRKGEQLPLYRINDLDFDCMVARLAIPIDRGKDLEGAIRAFVDWNFGTTIVRIYAGGASPTDGHVELIEPNP